MSRRKCLHPDPHLLEERDRLPDGRIRCREAVPGGVDDRRQGQAGLERPHRRQVVFAVDRPAPDDGPHDGGKVDHRGIAGRLRLTARRNEKKRASSSACRAVPDVGEVVRPRIDELEDVVATLRIGHVEAYRTDAEVHLGDRIDGVVIDGDERGLGTRQFIGVAEAVERSRRDGAHATSHEPIDLLQVEHQREAVHEGFRCQFGSPVQFRSLVSHCGDPNVMVAIRNRRALQRGSRARRRNAPGSVRPVAPGSRPRSPTAWPGPWRRGRGPG